LLPDARILEWDLLCQRKINARATGNFVSMIFAGVKFLKKGGAKLIFFKLNVAANFQVYFLNFYQNTAELPRNLIIRKGELLMQKKLLVIFTAMMLAATFMPAVASAALFNFNYNGPGVTASGILTADSIGSGQFHITGVTGTRNAEAITSFAAGGPDNFFYNGTPPGANINNVLVYPANPGFLSNDPSYSGFVFGTASGEFNPYYIPGGLYNEYKLGGDIAGITINFNVAPVPIPAAVWLLGSGLVGLVALKRKFRP
jgi:hypothetical protein